eukprot:919302_1
MKVSLKTAILVVTVILLCVATDVNCSGRLWKCPWFQRFRKKPAEKISPILPTTRYGLRVKSRRGSIHSLCDNNGVGKCKIAAFMAIAAAYLNGEKHAVSCEGIFVWSGKFDKKRTINLKELMDPNFTATSG